MAETVGMVETVETVETVGTVEIVDMVEIGISMQWKWSTTVTLFNRNQTLFQQLTLSLQH